MKRNTHQKQVILDYLKSVTSHPTAEEVFEAVKEKLPSISRSTVYRVLKIHGQKQEIAELGNEINRYDANLAPHSHFICQKCKKVFDIFNGQDMLKVQPKNQIKYMCGSQIKECKVENFRVCFYGVCSECSSRAN